MILKNEIIANLKTGLLTAYNNGETAVKLKEKNELDDKGKPKWKEEHIEDATYKIAKEVERIGINNPNL